MSHATETPKLPVDIVIDEHGRLAKRINEMGDTVPLNRADNHAVLSALRSAGERVREECAKVADELRAGGGRYYIGTPCEYETYYYAANVGDAIRALPVQGEVKAVGYDNKAFFESAKHDYPGAAPTEPPLAGAKIERSNDGGS